MNTRAVQRLRLLCVALALIPCALLAAGNSDNSGLALRAQLYVQVGDYYASRQEARKAADAYRQAAELAKEHLPAAKQTEISRRLADVNDMAPAIDNLRSQCERRQNSAESCLLLARYLSWNNRPISASKVGRELLRHQYSNEIIITQANALSWQGDNAGALPLYRQAADSNGSFNTKLSFARTLLATANFSAARAVRAQLRAESEIEQALIHDLDWQMRREARPRAWLGTDRYRDIYDAGFTRSYLGLAVPLSNSWLRFKGGRVSSSDGRRDAEVDHHELGGMIRLHDRARLKADVGRTSPRDDTIDALTTAGLGLTATLPQTRVALNIRREVVDDSPQALTNSILRTTQELLLNYQITDRWGARLYGEHTIYSDHNRSLETKLSGLYTFYFGPPRLSIGLAHENLAFDRQSGGGYFDPDDVSTNKLLFVVSKYQDRFSGMLELYVGNQSVERSGTLQKNNIAGGYAALRYHIVEHAQIELTWEGANLGLDEADAYRYNQTQLKGYIFF